MSSHFSDTDFLPARGSWDPAGEASISSRYKERRGGTRRQRRRPDAGVRSGWPEPDMRGALSLRKAQGDENVNTRETDGLENRWWC